MKLTIIVIISLIFIIIVLMMLEIWSFNKKLNKLDNTTKELDIKCKDNLDNCLNLIEKINKLEFYKDELENRIDQFNINYSNDKELIKTKIHNEINIINKRVDSINMNLGKVRNSCKANTNDLVVLNNKFTDHLTE